jgi:Na+/H+ antiporter NhaC
LLFPRAIFRAFVRGQRSLNLYHNTISNSEAKQLTAAEICQRLHIPAMDEKLKPTVAEYFLFGWWMLLAALVSLLSLLAVPVIAVFNIYVFAGLIFSTKKQLYNGNNISNS